MTLDEKLKEVTRLEVIDDTGRAYIASPKKIELELQDDGRTLKIFVTKKKPTFGKRKFTPPREAYYLVGYADGSTKLELLKLGATYMFADANRLIEVMPIDKNVTKKESKSWKL